MAIYAVALLSQLSRFFEIEHIPLKQSSRIASSLIRPHQQSNGSATAAVAAAAATAAAPAPPTGFNSNDLSVDVAAYDDDDNVDGDVVTGCWRRRHAWLQDRQNIYYNAHFGFRVVAIHLVPCTTLIVLNVLLVRTMRAAKRRRDQLMARSVRRAECRHLTASNLTTLMLVVVVGVFLLVEFPLAILILLLMIHNTFRVPVMEHETQISVSLVINTCILFSYPINFFIYCAMSRKFRDTMRQLLFCRRAAADDATDTAGNGYGNNGTALESITMTVRTDRRVQSSAV